MNATTAALRRVFPWRVVTLDAMGTLLRPRKAIGATYVRFFQEVTRQQLSSERVALAVAHIDRRFPLVFEQQSARKPNFGRATVGTNSDGGDPATAYAWWSELILNTLPTELSREMSDDAARQFTSKLYAHYATGEAWHVFDDVRPTLDALRDQNVALGVISNFDERMDAILRDLALREYFAIVTTSWEHGEMKPCTSIFTSTFAALMHQQKQKGFAPNVGDERYQNVLHVGDHRERDYHGARMAGAQALWLQRRPKERFDVSPRHIIMSLESILLAEDDSIVNQSTDKSRKSTGCASARAMDEDPSSCVSVEDVERIADELVHDFDGTCLLIANEIVSSLDPVPLLEIVKHIGSERESGGNDEDADRESGCRHWLSDDLFERFETDFMPQIVQLVMRRYFDRECVKPANSFLQFMLEKVKSKLLTGDPCLLHSLIHILDEQGLFYAYHGTSATEEDDNADDGSGEAERSASRESEKQQFAIMEKNPYVSVYFLRNLQFWGEIGGFSLFLISLHSTSSEGENSEDDTILPFEAVRCIFRTLYTVKDYLTSHFLLQYFRPFCDGLRFFMGKLSSAEFHSLSRESLLEVVQVMELVLIKVLQIQDQRLLQCKDGFEEEEESTRDVLKQSVQLLRLEILLRQFRSSSLEKRIYGLSEIVTLTTRQFNEQVQEQPNPTASSLMVKLQYLVTWLHEKEIVEELFGEKLHAELIKRSVPLFQFVSELECFDPKWLDLVWNCYGGTSSSPQQAHLLQQRHEAHRTTVQDLLMELVEFIDEPLLHHLFRKCQSILAIDAGQLSLLAVIALRSSTTAEEAGSTASTRGDSNLREQVLMHLWTAVIPTAMPDALVDQVLQWMEDIIRKDASEKEVSRENSSEELGDRSSAARSSIALDLTERFCRACVDHVRRRQQIHVSLNLFTRLALLVAEMKWDVPALTTPGENSIAVILLNELRDYKTAVLVQVASNSAPHSLKSKEDASISHQSAVQLNEIKVRLLALRAAWIMESTICSGSSSSFSLPRAQLDLVWQLLIEKTVTSGEASLCFEWIELCMNTPVSISDDDNSESGTSSLLSPQLVEHLLIHKFSSLSGDCVTLSTLCCFHRLFRYANLRNGGLQIFAAQSSDDDECAPADSDSVVDLITGEPLIGLEQLWHLAVKSTKPEVAEECITLLTSFYLEFVPDLQGAEITLQKKLEFVEMCMGFLTSAKAQVDQIPETSEGCSSEEGTAESVAIVNRCVDLLRYFMDACDATLDVLDANTRHRSSDASDRVSSDEVLGLRGYSLGESKLQRKVFELENLEERLQHLEIYPSPMKDTQQSTSAGQAELILNSSRRPSWAFCQNHALLDAIPDEDENEVSEGNDVLSRWRKAPMQDNNEEPLLVSPGVNTQDNRHFSSEEMPMSPRGSLLLLSKSAMRSPTVRIRPNLQWPQDVSPQRGPDLSLEDISKALQEVDCEVGEESRARTIDSQAKSSSASPSLKKPKYSLMSQILANEDTYFDTLLQLVDWNDATSQRTWELICRLPTNNELLRKMIRLRPSNAGASEDVVWIDLLNTTNIHRLLYALRLVEALLLPVEDAAGEAGADQTSDSARRQWRERFVRLGGAKHLYEMLLRWELVHLVGQSDASGVSFVSAYTSNLTATCLAAVVRTLNYFVQLFRKAPREKQRGAEACSFDVRLTLATLPAFMRSISLKSLGESAVRLTFAYSSCKHESPSCRGTDTGKNACISAQTEEAIQCGIQLFTAVVSLNPDLLIGGLWGPPINSKESRMQTKRQSSPSLMEWIKSILLNCPSSVARNMALRSLIELTTEDRICKSKSLFVEELVRGLSDTLLNSSNETGQLQLFALLDSLLSFSAPRLEISPRQSVVSWLFENFILQRVLTKLHEHVTHAKKTDEEFICGYLEILRSLVLLSDKLRESALSYHPENELKGEDPSSASHWTVNLLLKHLLFGNPGSAADSNADHDFIVPKCKSDRSRELAQMLLSTLVAPAREALPSDPTTFANHMLKSHDAFQKSVLATLRARGRPWNFSPRDLLQDSENEIFHAGLVNPGCICYMNALVQQLFMTPSFREGLLSVDCMSTVSSSSSQWSDEIAELQKLFVSLAFTNFRSFDPTAFALSHQDLDGNPTDLRVQMDADEFFCLLLDRIDTNLQSVAQELHHEDANSNISSQGVSNFLEKCFGGVLVNQIITEQGHVSEREEKFFALSLEVSKKQHLKDSLALYVQGESLNGENAYFCEHLQQKVSATKRICIKKLPQTLVCHLKRFEFDFDTMEKLKINDYLEFPQAIDMFPFTSEALSPSQEQLPHGSEDEQDTGNEGGSSTMYDLVGIVVHSGTSDMGHYYSFIKDRAHPERWLEFNDEVVREFEIDMIGDECFGGEEIKQVWDGNARVNKVQMKRRNAYMLMYERCAEPVAFSVRKQEGVTEMSKASQLSRGSVNPSLRALIKETCQENAQFQSVVDVFGSTYSQFMKMVVDQAFSSSCDSSAKSSIGGNTLQDWDGVLADLPCEFVRLQACVLGCQYLFGMASLQSSSTNHASLHSQNDLIKQIVDWLTTEDPETVDAGDTEKCAFSAWLLRQAIASPSQENVSVARSWIFDVAFLNESNPDLVDGCLDILSASVLVLTRQLSSKDKHCGKDNSCHRTAIVDFYRVLLDLFHDREQTVELADPTSGGAMTLSTTTVVSAISRIGILLENCVCAKFADSAEERETTHQIFIRDLQYFDRLLFTLQAEQKSSDHFAHVSSLAVCSDSSYLASSLGEGGSSRARSCMLEIERRIVKELLGSLSHDSSRVSSGSYSPQQQYRSRGNRIPVDVNLVLNQTALSNMLRFNLHEELAPVLIQITECGSSSQRDRLLSLLMTALEDVKTTHLEQIFRVFHVLLDFEEQAVESEVGVPSVIEKVPVHQHLFSASKGILEAAGYYKDHRILHEYTFQLLKFCVNRAKSSLLLQQLFKLDEELYDQVSWISSWLVKYLDPTGSIRLQRHGRKSAVDEAECKQIGSDLGEEDADNEIIVNALFENIEKSFGCSVFPNKEPSALQGERPWSLSQDELPGHEDSRLSDVNQNGGDNHSALSLEDIVPEFGEARNPKAATSNTSKLTIVISNQGPETEDDENDHDHDLNNRERSPRMDDKKYSVGPEYTPLQAIHAPSTRAFAMRDLMYSHRSNEA